MATKTALARWSLFCGLFPLVLGCSSGPAHPPLVKGTGTVTWKGKPLAGALVQFIPSGETKGFGATAKTNSDGLYSLKYQTGAEGIPAGTYKVVISRRLLPDGTDPKEDLPPIENPAKETLPASYSSPELTKLTAQVDAAGKALDFALK